MKEIQLTQGKTAIVDDEDFEYLNQWKWYAKHNKYTYYAMRDERINKIKNTVRMHRLILDVPQGLFIDHINHNGFDNRKENLRICTHSQNSMNCKKRENSFSIYKGVTFNKILNNWRATITLNNKQIQIGGFSIAEEAAMAYNQKAVELFGEFAYLNKTE
jgi:hypothetical protein